MGGHRDDDGSMRGARFAPANLGSRLVAIHAGI
jgi:hypothetical protein